MPKAAFLLGFPASGDPNDKHTIAKFAKLPVLTDEGKRIWLKNYYETWQFLWWQSYGRWRRIKISYKESNALDFIKGC